jgi:vacuolar-type H+-ATPase subunit I/STV1
LEPWLRKAFPVPKNQTQETSVDLQIFGALPISFLAMLLLLCSSAGALRLIFVGLLQHPTCPPDVQAHALYLLEVLPVLYHQLVEVVEGHRQGV